jgi:hypothetical protein
MKVLIKAFFRNINMKKPCYRVYEINLNDNNIKNLLNNIKNNNLEDVKHLLNSELKQIMNMKKVISFNCFNCVYENKVVILLCNVYIRDSFMRKLKIEKLLNLNN